MASDYLRWEKLDNTANIFPVIAGDEITNTYRISVVLNEPVEPELLQKAVDIVTPRIPGFNLRLRSGAFWYYLEENKKRPPIVREEDTYPCRYIHPEANNDYMFRVTYYKKRINLEVFHAVADGMGGINFLKELTYQYLRLAHRELFDRYGDGLDKETSLDREDSFVTNYAKSFKMPYKTRRAFLIKGEKLPYNAFGVIHGILSVSQLKKISRDKYGVSINEYLISTFVYATYQKYKQKMSRHQAIRVAVPVNLRPFFDSMTTKNFFSMVSAEFIPDRLDYTFEEVVGCIHESLKKQITKENLEKIFSFTVSNTEWILAKIIPLPIKNLVMRIAYSQSALANTTTITNIGNIRVDEGYKPYIDSFYCFIPFSKGQHIKGTIASYEDKLIYSFVSAYQDTGIQKRIFRQIASDGADVSIETNGVYYE